MFAGQRNVKHPIREYPQRRDDKNVCEKLPVPLLGCPEPYPVSSDTILPGPFLPPLKKTERQAAFLLSRPPRVLLLCEILSLSLRFTRLSPFSAEKPFFSKTNKSVSAFGGFEIKRVFLPLVFGVSWFFIKVFDLQFFSCRSQKPKAVRPLRYLSFQPQPYLHSF